LTPPIYFQGDQDPQPPGSMPLLHSPKFHGVYSMDIVSHHAPQKKNHVVSVVVLPNKTQSVTVTNNCKASTSVHQR